MSCVRRSAPRSRYRALAMLGVRDKRPKAFVDDLRAGVYVTNGSDLFYVVDRTQRFQDENGNLQQARVLVEDCFSQDPPYWVAIGEFMKSGLAVVLRD